MKTLVILAIILAIIAVYFIFNTKKSISIGGGGNAVPAGIDIAKLILNKALNQVEKISQETVGNNNNIGSGILQSKLAEEIKLKIGDIKDKILDETVNLITKPIENKISETFCPIK